MSRPHGDRFDDLLRIAVSYKRQAEKCAGVKAYHASSIFLASAVEASILAMYYCFSSQARKSKTYRSLKNGRKNILYWDLFQLVRLAKELKWIPPKVSVGRSRYSISDTIDQLRQTRNTIHPGNYLRTRDGNLVGVRDFKRAERIFQNCLQILEEKLVG
jgi:hypothetical protein